MNRLPSVIAGLVFAAAVAALVYWRTRELPAAPPVPVAEPAAPAPEPVAEAPSAPAIRHPIEAAPAAAQASGPLPLPADADRAFGDVLGQHFGHRNIASFLQLDGFARRVVATVDNLPRQHAAPRLWPMQPAPGRFTPEAGAAGETIGAANAKRYQPVVAFVTAVDPAAAAAVYVRFHPLFQQAYQELGYPRGYFNDRLVEVIDHLLATPEPAGAPAVRRVEVKGPVAPTRPWLQYEFTDPALASRSAGQKLLLRVSADQRRQLKAALRAFRAQIVQADPAALAAPAAPAASAPAR